MKKNESFIVIVGTVCIFALTSCAETMQDAFDTCPYGPIEYMPGVQPDFEVDNQHHRIARAGCVRHYGEGACLVRLIKSGDLSYRAVCRRAGK